MLVKGIVGVIIAAVFLAGASMVLPGLNDMRREAKLTFEEPLQGVPPILVMTTTALGCFRGIIADLLWLRAAKLKEEGRFFEHLQLSDWICKLTPRFPMVWAHRAWDMAYNISVELPTAEERWRWVSRGIELLRDEGLKYNPSSAEIHKELAWILFHKVGGELDDMHWYYKEALLKQMEDVLGEGREPDIESMAAAPRTREGLLEDSAVNALVAEFDALEIDITKEFFALAKGDEEIAADVRSLFDSRRKDEAMMRVEAYCRAKRLRDELKLEPKDMKALMDEYGPLDWRVPASLSLYWIKRGLEHAPEDSTINYDRIAYFSIQDIYRKGRIDILTLGDQRRYVTSPDYRFAEVMERSFRKNIDHYEGLGKSATGTKGAYNYFLESIVWDLYLSGNTKRAAEFYKKRFPDKPVSPLILRDFVRKNVSENIKNASRHDAVGTIEILLGRAWWSFAVGNDDEARFFENRAKLVHEIYSEDQSGAEERMGLLPFKIMKQDVLTRIRRGEFIPMPFPKILLDNLAKRIVASKSDSEP